MWKQLQIERSILKTQRKYLCKCLCLGKFGLGKNLYIFFKYYFILLSLLYFKENIIYVTKNVEMFHSAQISLGNIWNYF